MLGLVVWAEWPLLMQGSGCASIFHFPNPFALHHPTWRAMYILSAQQTSPTGVLIHTFAWFLDSTVKHGCGIDLDWVYFYHGGAFGKLQIMEHFSWFMRSGMG
mmetsp:Transcript_32187/g.67250  ORF Transcript_32187/g.67250 Transcript_32187/m.67250 type:complete len:103 (-) Transcript_32187:23-331(-)